MTRFLLGLIALLALPLNARELPDIPFERFTLDNGLSVVVHTDRKAPIVAVSVWYHVGSKDEPVGRSGFAHLFEHLMFNGTENYNDEYFGPFEQVGATGMNGTTFLDRTNYFQTVPTTALDMALWMESDRMGHLLGAIDQAKLDEQRGVVQNEKREGDNQPYGQLFEELQSASFPLGHPYHHTTIGSMDDLNAASLEDVKGWFERWYGAANATLVLAGDIDMATAKAKVERYFGHLASGPALTRPERWIAKRSESSLRVIHDRVPQVRWVRSWNVAPLGDADADYLDLAAELLGGGKTSRLYKRLVYDEQVADRVQIGNSSYELAGMFAISVDIKQGIPTERVAAIVEEELAKLLSEGPDAADLSRAQIGIEADFVRGVEQIGGFGGKADVLASGQTYLDNPGYFREALKRTLEATPDQVRAAAQRWLSSGDLTIITQPFAARDSATADPVDRSAGPPAVTEFPEVVFPTVESATLSNGIPVQFARRSAVPTVYVSALFDGGYTADQGGKLGTAAITMAMLDEGAGKYSALELAARLEELGASISSGASLDHATVSLSALSDQLPDSLALLADVIRRPSFAESELERLRSRWISGIAQEKAQPVGLALRLLPPILYGRGHPYAIPFTGTGTVESVSSITQDDLRQWHAQHLHPQRMQLVVVGDTSLKQILPQLERAFGGWKSDRAPADAPALTAPAAPEQPTVYLLDRPGAPQSLVLAGMLAPPVNAPDETALDAAVAILGGLFSSRLNMNLREDKHWAYGAYAFLSDALGPRPLMLYAPVQTDHTADALAELRGELQGYLGDRPPTAEELKKINDNQIRGLPGQYETAGAVAGAMLGVLRYQRPANWVAQTKQRLEAVTVAQTTEAARAHIRPERLVWLVVGDLQAIEGPVRELGLGRVQVLDESGAVLR